LKRRMALSMGSFSLMRTPAMVPAHPFPTRKGPRWFPGYPRLGRSEPLGKSTPQSRRTPQR